MQGLPPLLGSAFLYSPPGLMIAGPWWPETPASGKALLSHVRGSWGRRRDRVLAAAPGCGEQHKQHPCPPCANLPWGANQRLANNKLPSEGAAAIQLIFSRTEPPEMFIPAALSCSSYPPVVPNRKDGYVMNTLLP